MKSTQEVDVEQMVREAVFKCLGMQTGNPVLERSAEELFHSPRAIALKQEMVESGRKLWNRAYVDGNGGNITARLSPRYILCTPTLCSKGDLHIEDICLVDLENRQVCGERMKSSEIKLHLEIFNNVPQANAVIHCHPPYATAHAIAGRLPQANLVPEKEVFIGLPALAPYETPGTMEFARTVRPLVRRHNTILLANHGIVCWADTVTHAEWYVEIVETYCKTLMIASQLRSPLPELAPEKMEDLLRIKATMGLPDPRLPTEIVEQQSGAPTQEAESCSFAVAHSVEYFDEVERTIQKITEEVRALLHR